jgi:hypothetical protein
MTTVLPTAATGSEDAFLDAACQALAEVATVADPLDALGWFDLLEDLTDPDMRTAVFALFRAQGRELAGTPALGALLAQPFLALTGHSPGSLLATATRRSPRRGARQVVVGDPTGRALLVDHPDGGLTVVAADEAALRPVPTPGRLVLRELDLDATCLPAPVVDEATAAPARARAVFLGRIALACEILGTAEAALATAVAYAGTREQFGQPIGMFQAVRHLLARAATQSAALASVTATAVRLDAAAPAHYDEVVKALAGRDGRGVCESSLQVLGAIGFTTEHTHHHRHSRVLSLDALLGSSAKLTHALGARLRETGADSAAPFAALLTAHLPAPGAS